MQANNRMIEIRPPKFGLYGQSLNDLLHQAELWSESNPFRGPDGSKFWLEYTDDGKKIEVYDVEIIPIYGAIVMRFYPLTKKEGGEPYEEIVNGRNTHSEIDRVREIVIVDQGRKFLVENGGAIYKQNKYFAAADRLMIASGLARGEADMRMAA